MRWVKNGSSSQRRIWIWGTWAHHTPNSLDVRADIQRLIRQLNYLPDPSLVPHALCGVADTGFNSIILKHLLSGAFLEHLGPNTWILCRLSLLTPIISQSPPTVGNWQAWSPWRFVFAGSPGWGQLLFLQRDSDEDMRWSTLAHTAVRALEGQLKNGATWLFFDAECSINKPLFPQYPSVWILIHALCN